MRLFESTKKLFYFFIIAFAFGFLFSQKDTLVSNANFLLQSPCDTPIEYRIGRVDKEYRTTREAFLTQIQQSADAWNEVQGKPLFIYDSQADLAVNLIYSERQSILDQLEQLEGDLGTGKTSLDAMIVEYQTLSRDFRYRLGSFNQEVALWNKRGGAPPDVFQRLIEEHKELQVEADRLNALAEQLNLSVEKYNIQVGEFNEAVQIYKEAMEARPEAGLYDGAVPKIDIYLTISDQELIHTLIHEFGHALGLEHNNDPQAIMYPLSNEITNLSPTDISALEMVCEQRNLGRYINHIRENFWQKITDLLESKNLVPAIK